jgi:four helix bundle protein
LPAGFKTLHDIEAWIAAKDLAREIYLETRDGPASRDFGFRDQIQRAAVSTMTNVAESHGRRSPADKARFLDVARGSGKEVQSLVFLGREIGYFSDERSDELLRLSDRALSLITGWARYLRGL